MKIKILLTTSLFFAFSFIHAQDVKSLDSTNSPITKRIGLTCFPLNNKAGLTYCFGKKGRIKIEYDFKLSFSDAYDYSSVSDELKLMYAWKSNGFKKVYSGVGAEYGIIYNNSYAGYNAAKAATFFVTITPIGIELFPTSRLPGFSIILESKLKIQPHGLYGFARVGLCCYFSQIRHNGKRNSTK